MVIIRMDAPGAQGHHGCATPMIAPFLVMAPGLRLAVGGAGRGCGAARLRQG
nr:hypothetical protein RSP673_22485 [Ralstonia solanacearum P673]